LDAATERDASVGFEQYVGYVSPGGRALTPTFVRFGSARRYWSGATGPLFDTPVLGADCAETGLRKDAAHRYAQGSVHHRCGNRRGFFL